MAVAVAERLDGLEEGYKSKNKGTVPGSVRQKIRNCCKRRKRKRKQRGGILPAFLIPAAIAAAKAAAAGAISAGSGYGSKKALEAATCKKRVGKISAAQWAASKRQVQ